jgi:hypothetical protein
VSQSLPTPQTILPLSLTLFDNTTGEYVDLAECDKIIWSIPSSNTFISYTTDVTANDGYY